MPQDGSEKWHDWQNWIRKWKSVCTATTCCELCSPVLCFYLGLDDALAEATDALVRQTERRRRKRRSASVRKMLVCDCVICWVQVSEGESLRHFTIAFNSLPLWFAFIPAFSKCGSRSGDSYACSGFTRGTRRRSPSKARGSVFVISPASW